MNVIFNIIVLLFEVLYYALFMKFARKEGNLWRYLLLFIINSFVISLCSNIQLPIYLLFIFITLFGFKYIVKTKTSLYDVIFILVMLLLKIVIEFSLYTFFNGILSFSIISATLIFEIAKIIILFSLKNKLHKIYSKLKYKWDNNNFYIRYLFSTILYSYVIITLLLLIKLV